MSNDDSSSILNQNDSIDQIVNRKDEVLSTNNHHHSSSFHPSKLEQTNFVNSEIHDSLHNHLCSLLSNQWLESTIKLVQDLCSNCKSVDFLDPIQLVFDSDRSIQSCNPIGLGCIKKKLIKKANHELGVHGHRFRRSNYRVDPNEDDQDEIDQDDYLDYCPHMLILEFRSIVSIAKQSNLDFASSFYQNTIWLEDWINFKLVPHLEHCYQLAKNSNEHIYGLKKYYTRNKTTSKQFLINQSYLNEGDESHLCLFNKKIKNRKILKTDHNSNAILGN